MNKTVYLVRHAQGEHNISDNFYIQDAKLTSLGKSQCLSLRQSFAYHDEVDIVMASPLTRAIETAVLGFEPALERDHVKLLLVPQAQEISNKPCDIGLEREELEKEMEKVLAAADGEAGFDLSMIDYGTLEPGWNSKIGSYEASLKAVEQRAADLRCWLWGRPEKTMVLVTHGAFLHYLTEDWGGFVHGKGTAYKNCEVRAFRFTGDSDREKAHLVHVDGGQKVGKPVGAHEEDILGVKSG